MQPARKWSFLPLVRRFFAVLCFASALSAFGFGTSRAEPSRAARRCSSDMVRVHGFCIDRFEISTVDAKTGEALSPYYPPTPKLAAGVRDSWLCERDQVGSPAARAFPLPELSNFQREHNYEPRAVSRAGVVPQAYLSYGQAKKACENAHKRLCTKDEWVTACRGQKDRQFPYGDSYKAGQCNVHRALHAGYVLHAASSIGLLDPRLNLVEEGDDPLLHLTGDTAACASEWGSDRIYDMVGNLDEWVDDAMFLGGFYARPTLKGCDAQISSHAQSYFDYTTGTRCCSGLPP